MLETLVSDIIPKNDEQRIAALHRFEILYTSAEEVFDNITQMIAQVFKTPMAFISLVDKDTVFYKSQVGPFGRDTVHRVDSLCSLTILSKEPLIIEDAGGEACFENNPYVAAAGGIRFYAGAPLITKEGLQIGAVCIVDTIPRTFSEKEVGLLVRFASLVMHEIEVRHITLTELQTAQEVVKTNEQLHRLSRQLQLDQERFELVSKATQDVIWDWNLITNEIWWNEGFQELFGYKKEDIEPTIDSWYNRVHPEDRERVVSGIHAVIDKGGTNWSDEYRFRKADGSYAIVLDRGYALHDEKGKPYRMLGSMLDITERKVAEESLQGAHERIVDILESTTDAFYSLDADFNFTYVNKRAAQLWGRGRDGLIGKHYWTEFPNAVGSESYHKHYEVHKEGKPVQFEAISPLLGTWIDASIYPGKDGGVSVFFRSITKRKRAEEALRLAMDAARLGTYDIDLIQRTIVYSPRVADIFGLDTMQQWNYNAFIDAVHPDDIPIRTKAHQEAQQTGELFYEVRIILPDASIRWIRINGKYRMQDTTPVSLAGTVMDITAERKAAELLEQKIEERTHELKQVNEQLKQFTYAASHDLQEPLRKISFFLDRLLTNIGPTLNEENRRIADRIEYTTRRMQGLINDLLAYSNTTMGVTDFDEVALDEVIKGVLDDMEATIIQNGATVNVQHLPVVKGDQRQLRQLFQNLISNALKYHKKEVSPQVTITTKLVTGADTEDYLAGARKEDPYYLIEVKDNGIGFDPDDANRIFKLFQRLHGKAEYEGTGVGLAIVQKVVENHDGYIWAEGKPGEGATFKILLPTEKSNYI